MTDPKEIYLAPACHAEMEEGRTWAEDQAWDDCHDCGNEPVRYVLASGYDALAAERDELRTALAATDRLASEAAQRNEDMARALIRCKEWIYPPEGNCECYSCADAAALLSSIDAAIQGGKP